MVGGGRLRRSTKHTSDEGIEATQEGAKSRTDVGLGPTIGYSDLIAKIGTTGLRRFSAIALHVARARYNASGG